MRYIKPKKSNIRTVHLSGGELEVLRKMAVQSQLLSTSIPTLSPDMGFYIKVDVLNIPERIFPKEYAQIREIYGDLLKRLDLYYKETNPR